jgi:hypothetical protein
MIGANEKTAFIKTRRHKVIITCSPWFDNATARTALAFFMFTARPFIQTAIDASHQNIAVTFGRMRQGIACLFTASFDTHALFACRAIRTRDTRHDAAFTNDLYAIAVTRGIKIRLNA